MTSPASDRTGLGESTATETGVYVRERVGPSLRRGVRGEAGGGRALGQCRVPLTTAQAWANLLQRKRVFMSDRGGSS